MRMYGDGDDNDGSDNGMHGVDDSDSSDIRMHGVDGE